MQALIDASGLAKQGKWEKLYAIWAEELTRLAGAVLKFLFLESSTEGASHIAGVWNAL